MILSHRTALDPTVKQSIALLRACGVARFTYNWALSTWNEQFQAGEKPSANKLKLLWNKTKATQFPWVYDSPKDANQQPFSNLQNAFNRFFKKQAKFPQFKKRGVRDSFYISNDQLTLGPKKLRLPKIGWVRIREPLRFDGKIMSATVSRDADRWFVAIQVEVEDPRIPRTADGVVGIDLGLTSFATLSTGEQIEAPKPLRVAQKCLRRKQRVLSRRQKGSKRRNRARVQVAKIHRKVRSIRQDFLHKLSTNICRENQAVAIEDLNVKGMIRNRHLSRAISDVGWGEFRRQLEYKSLRYGTQIVVADRFYPSTKRCSACGSIQEMPLNQRVYSCGSCGFTSNRDLNAARNLEQLITPGFGENYARGLEGSGVLLPKHPKPCQEEARTTPRVYSRGLT